MNVGELFPDVGYKVDDTDPEEEYARVSALVQIEESDRAEDRK